MEYECDFKKGKLSIRNVDLSHGEALLSDPFVRNITVIVGKTGAGKTNLLQLLGMPEELRLSIKNKSEYFIVYSVDSESNLFAIEVNRLIPHGLSMGGKAILEPTLIYFSYDKGKIRYKGVRQREDEPETVIVNSFVEESIQKDYFDGIHIDGIVGETMINPRCLIPYSKVNARVACVYTRDYIEGFPEESIKRDAAFSIKSINWHDKLRNELNPELLKKEYYFYHDFLQDKRWKSLIDVPKYFDRNVKEAKGITFKQQFIHDLLTDFALYLRKWAAIITPLSNAQLMMREAMGMIQDEGIEDPHILPDGRCDDIRKRINWLCQYIDLHTDEKYGNKGLLWQIGTDIIDIVDALGKFDDRHFEDGRFIYFIEDMDFNDRALIDLFERMAGYHGDQLGVFTSELLPFEITNLSSGEYQYAKVFGIVDEVISTFRNKTGKDGTLENIILLLDEPETFMHPEMCRRFIYWMGRLLNDEKCQGRVQVIMSTHSPFMLSDVLPRQIMRMDFDERGLCKVLSNSDNKTFAGDIHSIMAHEFFLDYTIGELSRHRIESLINILQGDSESKDILESYIPSITPEIGDVLIRKYLEYYQKGGNHDIS